MRHRRFVFVLIAVLALIVPAVTTAQGGIGNSVVLTASLHGDADIPPGDPDGFGFAKVRIDLVTSQVCYRLSVAATDTPVAAHIHHGAAGTNGPVVVPFTAPADGLSNGCVDITADLAAAIANNPSEYYVNVHTATFPAGAVRGQLDWLGGQPDFRMPDATSETIADGLNFPRGLATGADGAVYVTDAGSPAEPDPDACITVEGEDDGGEDNEYCFSNTGSVIRIMDGAQTEVATGLPSSISDVVIADSGEMYVVTGLGGDPSVIRPLAGDLADGYAYILRVDGDSWTPIADIGGYEVDANPDGGAIDTNPFSLALTADGFLVADAGGNSLVHATMSGDVSTVAVFPPQMTDAPPFLELPPGTQIPMEAVPTSVAQGPDGAWYVGELSGFPFEVGAARVWRVMDENGDGDALDDGEMSVYADGFTAILDVAFDPHGHLYVLEMAKNGLLAVEEDPTNIDAAVGALIRLNDDGSRTEVLSGLLYMPIGLMIDADGAIYVTNLSLVPDMGEVLRIVVTE